MSYNASNSMGLTMRYRAYHLEPTGFLGLKQKKVEEYCDRLFGLPKLHCGYCDGPLRITCKGQWKLSTRKKPAPPGVQQVVEEHESVFIGGRAECTVCGALYRERKQNRARYGYSAWGSRYQQVYQGQETICDWVTVCREEYDSDVCVP